MKKFLLLTLVFMLIISSVPVYAGTDYITVIIDGEELVPKDANGNIVRPMLTKGTTYLPVRAVASALELDIKWDDSTKSVFINGTPQKAEKTNDVNVYINGEKILPMDVNGNVVNPILKDGTTYLPIRAISEAFNKEVSWEQEIHTVILTTPEVKDFEEGKIYMYRCLEEIKHRVEETYDAFGFAIHDAKRWIALQPHVLPEYAEVYGK